MAAAVVLRGDCDAQALRRLARSAGDPGQVRRLLALVAIYAGGSRDEAAEIGGVGLQTVRDWVLRFNKELRAMGFRKLSARPRHHAKDDAAEAAF